MIFSVGQTARPLWAAMCGLALLSVMGCANRDSDGSDADRSNKSHGQTPVDSTASFRDMADESGVRFVAHNGREAGHLAILESLGSGVATFDFDQDGLLDLFLPGGGRFSSLPEPVGLPSALFRNRGDLIFAAVENAAGVGHCPFYSHGVSVGDIDSDGFPDLLVTGYGGLLLYRNQGDGTFVDATVISGLTLRSWSTSAAWGDANGDGTLDLYVANYVGWSFANHPPCIVQGHRDICGPTRFEPLSDLFYMGNGDGTFRDATDEVGLVPGGKGLGVVAADLDLDGDLDYYVANDTTPNFLYRNEGLGRLQEHGLLSGTAFGATGEAEGSMGVDVGDFNGDGLPDLWVANYENQSFALYRNEGNCSFQHVSGVTGITAVGAQSVGFGTTFVDFDLDGDEDLFATNGHVMYHSTNAPLRQRPLLFENREGRRYVNVAETAGDYAASPHVGRGVACGDLDRDGDPDLVVSHINEPVALLRNDSHPRGSWLSVRLIGVESHRDAIGARVTVIASGRTFTQQLQGGSSYLSSSAHELLFGLGAADRIQSVEIIWPAHRGQPPRLQRITGIESTNRRLTLRESPP